MIWLLKNLVGLMQPLGLLWLGLIGLTIWHLRQSDRRSAKLVGSMAVLMTVMTCGVVGDRLVGSLEDPWRSVETRWETLPQADAIVCLGGGVRAASNEIVGLDFQQNSDRPTTAIELLRRNLAPRVVFGGGKATKGDATEGQAVKTWATKWQIGGEKIELLPPCVDTHDEAQRTAELVRQHGWKRLILVTSAAHMTRADAVFRKVTGIEIVPVPCAFATSRTPTVWLHLPSTEELDYFGTWVHEVLGRWVYYWRGWI
jgi:uncharacterized SAM-binding protein YcdF (DUF218 family)